MVFAECISWIVFLGVTSATSISLAKLMYTRKKSIENAVEENRRQNNITGRLLRQAIQSLVFQFAFMVLPYTYVVSLNMMPMTFLTDKEIVCNQNMFYCITNAVIPLFNPFSLGMLLKERRQNIFPSLSVRRIPNICMRNNKVYPSHNEKSENIHQLEVLYSVDEITEEKSEAEVTEFKNITKHNSKKVTLVTLVAHQKISQI